MDYKIIIRSVSSDNVTTNEDITNDVNTGFSIVEKLNEELDIGSMEIAFSNRSTPYGMFDIIRILIDDVLTYSMRIGGDMVKLVSKKPLTYSHSLSLVEHTKILERIVISGKTFTQPTDGSTQLSLYDVMDTLIKVFPLETIDLNVSTRIARISGDTQTYLESVISPEFTFKDTTLREALNQCVSYVDGVIRLDENSNLTIDFYNELIDLIDEETGNYDKTRKQDIEYFATSMTVDALNIVNDNIEDDAVEVYPAPSQYISLRSDQYIFDFTKSYIPTPKKIYSLKKVNLYMALTVENSVGAPTYFSGMKEIDISPRIYEKKSYDKLDVDGFLNDTEKKIETNFLQANTVYYEYGKKNIQVGDTSGIWDTDSNLLWTIKTTIMTQLKDEGYIPIGLEWDDISISFTPNTDESISNIFYTPMQTSIRYNVDRQDITDVYTNTTLFTNQQSRVINVENFLNNTQAKINKIGNSELKIANRVTDISNVYNVSDYTNENFVLTNKEIIFFKDFLDCNYELSRNWNMLSQFIGVNSEIRQYEIGEADRTLERDIIYKEFIEIDAVESGNGIGTNIIGLTTYGANTYLETFDISSTNKNVNVGFIDSEETVIDSSIVGISSNGGGNNLIFSFEFSDNKINSSNIDEINSQRAINFVSYTNDVGKLESLSLILCEDIDEIDFTNTKLVADALPKLSTTYAINKQVEFSGTNDLLIKKDNREVLKGVYSIQQVSKNVNKLILGRYLSRKNRLVTSSPPSKIYLHTYDNNIKFYKNDTLTAKSGATSKVELTTQLVVSTIDKKITITDSNLTSLTSSYCLTDENDYILIAVNQDGTLLNVITFDFNNKRTGITKFNNYQIIEIDSSAISSTSSSMIYILALNEALLSSSTASTSCNMIYELALNIPLIVSNTSSTSASMVYEYTLNEALIVSSVSTTSSSLTYDLALNENLLVSSIATTNVGMIYDIDEPDAWRVRYFDIDSNQIGSSQYILDGEDATEPTPPTVTGYTFDSWTRSNTNITDNEDIYSNYDINIYTVTFEVDGITYGTPESVEFLGSATTPTPTPTKASSVYYDYEFGGWVEDYSSITDNTTITNDDWIQTVRTDVHWEVVTSGTPTGGFCDDAFDVGHIKEELGCVYEYVQDYHSLSDESTPPPPCSSGATYTQCVWDKLNDRYSCTDYEGTIEQVLYECQLD